MENKSLNRLLKYIVAAAVCVCFIIAADTVYAKPELSRKLVIVEKGAKYNLGKIVKGSGKLSYKSKKNRIASVDKKGLLHSKKAGKTSILIKDSGGGARAKLSVKVVGSCTNYTIKKGKTISINKILSSNPKTSSKKSSSYKWVSSNSKIAKVVRGGKSIKAGKKGIAYLEGYRASSKETKVLLKITVGTPVNKIKLSQSQYVMGVGSKIKLDCKVMPAKASNRKVYYEVSNPSVLSINSGGKMSAKKSGETTVTVRSKDGHEKKSFTVVVAADLVRSTNYGKVEGTVVNSSCIAWFGVPYAKPPVGELRWRAPQEQDSWHGILQTKDKKGKAAQAVTVTKSEGSEDCLYLNIYRPNTEDGNLPVLVYLHGGSNISGSASKSFKNLAVNANAIVVSVEYRLGALGWLNLDALKTGNPEEDSGNYGLLDIKKSLQWVQANISYFGGNAGNVTLSGFSAGGRNALAAMISPIMRGLFHKAVIFSGGMTTCTVDDGQKSAKEKLAKILVRRGTYTSKKDALAWIEKASNDELRQFLYGLSTDEAACMYTYMGLKLSNAPQLFADGYVIPSEGFDVISKGSYNAVPVIFGSASQEFSTYALNANYYDAELNADVIKKGWGMISLIQNAKKFGSMYQSYYYIEHNLEKFSSSGIQPPMYAYRFDWGNDADIVSDFHAQFLGSYHGLDIDFLCGIYKNDFENYVTDLYTNDNSDGRSKLTSKMQRYIGNFLRTGNPNGSGIKTWNPWNGGQNMKVMVFDASEDDDMSYMSSMHYSREYVDGLMKSMLTDAQCRLLKNKVFAGRYFMPDDSTTAVPDDESNNLVETPEEKNNSEL